MAHSFPTRRSSDLVIQSPAEARCQATATSMWMPSMRARMAAGSSVASWNKAVERAGPERMPIWRRRSLSRSGLIGWPGRPPSSSHGEVPWSPARARAQQLRQILSPSRCLLNATTRRQRGQAGRLMRTALASQSASMSRSTTGNGAFAPSRRFAPPRRRTRAGRAALRADPARRGGRRDLVPDRRNQCGDRRPHLSCRSCVLNPVLAAIVYAATLPTSVRVPRLNGMLALLGHGKLLRSQRREPPGLKVEETRYGTGPRGHP